MALLHSTKLYYCSTVFYRIVPGKRPWALAAQAPKLKVDSYTEKVLKWFNYPCTKAHPGCKNGTKSTCIISLSVLRRDQPDSGEGCIVLQRLVASLLSFCTFSHCLQYANIVLQGKNEAKDRCVWTFDVWCHGTQSASEQLQLCELSGPTFRFTTREFMGGCTKNHEKLQNCQNWGLSVWVLARDNTVLYSTTLYLTLLYSTTCSTWLREFQYNTESRCTTAGTAVYCLAIRDMSNHRIRWFIIFRMVYSKPLSVHRVR